MLRAASFRAHFTSTLFLPLPSHRIEPQVMSSGSGNKRARTGNESHAVRMGPAAVQQRIHSLPAAELPTLLENLLASHPEAHATFDNLSSEIIYRTRQLPPADFGELVAECQEQIRLVGPRQEFEAVADTVSFILETVDEIEQVCEEDKRSRTQIGAIRALVRIANEMLTRRGLITDTDGVAQAIIRIYGRLSGAETTLERDGIKRLCKAMSEWGVETLWEIA